jgi:recombination protein RecR
MYSFPLPLRRLIKEISKLPSIGEKSATRLAYHLVYREPQLVESLMGALGEVAGKIVLCERCYALTDSALCQVCTDPSRTSSIVCVIEKPIDIIAIERLGEFRGLYHVLHGLWSPLRGHDPGSLKVVELLNRIQDGEIEEVILATGATLEGDATALYIASELNKFKNVKVTRLAQGMPKGGELEYADDVTLSRAFSGRGRI